MTKQEIRQYLTTVKTLGLIFLIVASVVYWRAYFGLKNGEMLEPLERLWVNYANDQYVLWALAITVLIALTAISFISKFVDGYLNRRLVSTSLNKTLTEIVRCSADDETLVLRAKKIGIFLTAKTVDIKPEVLKYCSTAPLAKLLTALLYSLQTEIVRWEKIAGRGDKNVYQQLAAILINHWPAELINEFIGLVSEKKAYLAFELENAVQLEKLEKQIEGIRRQQAILEEKRLCQDQLDALVDQDVIRCLSRITGGSALKSWLLRLHPGPGGLVKG